MQRGKAFFVQPSSKKYPEIAVSRRDIGDAQVGDCVAVEVTSYGDDTYQDTLHHIVLAEGTELTLSNYNDMGYTVMFQPSETVYAYK